jgi:hypothetical protein
VVTSDHHDLGARQRRAKARKLCVRVQDGRVRRPDLMEDVSTDEDDVRLELDDLVERALERLRYVVLALIDAARSDPLVLAVSEMQVGEMDEAQRIDGEKSGPRTELTSCDGGSWLTHRPH